MGPSRPLRVLVVCTGNTCRTPMAAALLRRLFDGAGLEAEVRSAGTHATPGWPAHPDAQAVAAEAGLDLADHRAQPLTAELVAWSDVVLGMSQGHVERARRLDETADVRIVTAFDPAGPRPDGIRDPIGWGADVYRQVFGELERCLAEFVRQWGGDRGSDGTESAANDTKGGTAPPG